MLIAADWIIPVQSPPLREGAVLVRGTRIAAVGRFEELAATHPSEPLVELPGCVLSPGLVNAHTHLSLTVFEGLLEPAPFTEWLPRVVTALRALGTADLEASAALGASQCIRAGVTAVGDVGYGPEARAAAARLGLGGVFFWECLGVGGDELAWLLSDRAFPASKRRGRTLTGLSPHSVYTAGPGLLQAVYRRAKDLGVPCAVHAAESAAEIQLLEDGTGPLAAVAARVAVGFKPPRAGVVEYLDQLGVLGGTVLVHGVRLTPEEIGLVAAKGRGIVVCPRSNAFLRNGKPPVEAFLRAGIALALGTDSSASNSNLDLFAEARALRPLTPNVSAAKLLGLLTEDAARILSLSHLFGALRPGLQADLVAVRTGRTDSPEETLLEAGARATIDSVMSAGRWRVRSGRMLKSPSFETRAKRAAQKVRAALSFPTHSPS